MYVKICGVSNIIDAQNAIKAGTNAIGLVMGGKVLPVEVEPHAQIVREMIKQFPKNIDSYIVTHLTNADDILDLSNYTQSTGIQISEEIPLSVVKEIRKRTSKKIIKTVIVKDEDSIKKLREYQKFADFILLDSQVAGYVGGTGMTSDWNLCKELVRCAEVPVLLAGGLTPENVGFAIKQVRPQGVDVSTGVSTYSENYLRKDRKSEEKIQRFLLNTKKIAKEIL